MDGIGGLLLCRFLRLFLRYSFRLVSPFLFHLLPNSGNIVLCGFYRFTAPLIKLTGSLISGGFHTA